MELKKEVIERNSYSDSADTDTVTDLCKDVVVYSGEQPGLSWKADKAWCIRLLKFVSSCVKIHTLMAWYSTLGGAYSALGQHSMLHAKEAGNVSKQQLLLATELHDPLLISKCKLYMAFSLLQQGKTKPAIRIVREQYKFAIRGSAGSTVCDTKLLSMCVSAWQQIKLMKTVSTKNIQQNPKS